MGLFRQSVFAWLVLAGVAFAQSPDGPSTKSLQPKELPPLPPIPTQAPAEPAPVALVAEAAPAAVWFRTEFLSLSLPAAQVPFPLVTTTSDTNQLCAGALGTPGTSVLYGNQTLNNDSATGLRFTLGAWLDSDHDLGLEASGFFTFRENHRYFNGSNDTGNPPLYLPAYNLNCLMEDALVIADPYSQFAGSVRFSTDLKLWGSEVNGLFNIRRGQTLEWTFLAGLRYLDLRETWNLDAESRDLILNQSIALEDRFETINQFLGAQFGSRWRVRTGKFTFDVVGKFAMGGNQRTRTISGQFTSTGPDASIVGTFPGGFYAQPSNIGRQSDVQFAVMPALELKLAYEILPRLVASVGYDLFYLNQTIRVADQVDRNLNLSQNPILGANLPATSQVGPLPSKTNSDIFVNGLSLGLEIRY